MDRYDWDRLTHLQLGRYAECFVKMEFILYGLDVYSAEVDQHGIDLVIRNDAGCHYDVQVKSSRNLNYIFFPKDKFDPRDDLLAAVVLFISPQPPRLFLIPSNAWQQPNPLLASRDYQGRSSPREWGLNLSRKNLPLLEQYAFERVAGQL